MVALPLLLLACKPEKGAHPPADTADTAARPPDDDTPDTEPGCTRGGSGDDDGDGWCDEDCDDGDPDIHPNATERCDGVDNDCDGAVDDGVSATYYVDDDGDGYGETEEQVCSGESLDGYADNGSDCDDDDADVHPGAADDTRDGVDEDCDGTIDEDAGSSRSLSASATWTSAGVTLVVENATARSFDFGMAETGAGAPGWYGESCIDGDEPWGYDDYGYDVCHRVSASGGTLTSVSRPGDVANSTTLFQSSMAPDLTYVLFDPSSSDCWVWGDDPSYYGAYGCTEL
jgi:hypothetical protein